MTRAPRMARLPALEPPIERAPAHRRRPVRESAARGSLRQATLAQREHDDDECHARMERDFRAAEHTIASRKALNEVIRALNKFGKVEPALAAALAPGLYGMPEHRITMKVQQFFLALAHRYATNTQLAEFLYGRVNEKTLGSIRKVLHDLGDISDEDWGWMDSRARLIPHRR